MSVYFSAYESMLSSYSMRAVNAASERLAGCAVTEINAEVVSEEAHDDEDLAALDFEAGVDDGGGRVGVQVGARAAIAQVSEGFGAAAPEDLVQTFGLQRDLVSHGLLCLAAMSVRSWISSPSVERRGAIQGARAVQESRRWLPLSNA